MRFVLLVQIASTLVMVGLVWFVQVVHYPLLDRVGIEGFRSYEVANVERTAWLAAGLIYQAAR